MRSQTDAGGWCRHERCKIVEAHDAHDDDFAKRGRGRPITGSKSVEPAKRQRAPRMRAQLQADPDKVFLRHEERTIEEIYGDASRGIVGGDHLLRGPITGPVAILRCPECKGGGCGWCNETGEMTSMRFNLWKRDCG